MEHAEPGVPAYLWMFGVAALTLMRVLVVERKLKKQQESLDDLEAELKRAESELDSKISVSIEEVRGVEKRVIEAIERIEVSLTREMEFSEGRVNDSIESLKR